MGQDMSDKIKGGCLCGQVQFEVNGPYQAFHICHCSQCRRSTGSAHASNIFTDAENVNWLSGEDLVKRFIPDKPDMITKNFCSHCGSLVPYISLKSGKLVIPAGSLSEAVPIKVQGNIFWGDRADWYDSVHQVEKFEKWPKSPD